MARFWCNFGVETLSAMTLNSPWWSDGEIAGDLTEVRTVVDAVDSAAATTLIMNSVPVWIGLTVFEVLPVASNWQPPSRYPWPDWATEVGFESADPFAPTELPPSSLTPPAAIGGGNTNLVSTYLVSTLTGDIPADALDAGSIVVVEIHNDTATAANVTLAAGYIEIDQTTFGTIEVMPDEHRTLTFISDATNLRLMNDSDWKRNSLRPTSPFTSSFTAIANRLNLSDNSAGLGRFDCFPPQNPKIGDQYTVVDTAGVASSGTSFQTRCRFIGTGTDILQGDVGLVKNINLNTNRESANFVYTGPTYGWVTLKTY